YEDESADGAVPRRSRGVRREEAAGDPAGDGGVQPGARCGAAGGAVVRAMLQPSGDAEVAEPARHARLVLVGALHPRAAATQVVGPMTRRVMSGTGRRP